MTYASEIVVNIVKPGDIVRIVPNEKMPNLEREFIVDDITKNGFLTGCSCTSDGYTIPFFAIESVEIIGDSGKYNY